MASFERVICRVVFPEAVGFDERMALHRVPVAGDWISLGLDGEGEFPEHLLGLILVVTSVTFAAIGPAHENPPPPHVIVRRP